MESVAVIMTGGTLGKIHDSYAEDLTFPSKPNEQISNLLRQARCDHCRVQSLPQIDSLDMTDSYREELLKLILSAKERCLVVIHGTGTMELTAKFLDGKTEGKTVILTGAMRPFSLGASDASFNVGGSVIAAQTLPPGVYGTMNGRVFAAQELRKNVKAGRFDKHQNN